MNQRPEPHPFREGKPSIVLEPSIKKVMNKSKKIFSVLKTKAKSLGFSKQELNSVVSLIEQRLDVEDDATEEDLDSAVNDAVEEILPFLKLGQAQAQRTIARSKQTTTKKQGDEADDADEADDDSDGQGDDADEVELPDDAPQWAKAMAKMFSNAMKSGKTKLNNFTPEQIKDDRRNQVKAVVDSLGAYGKIVLKKFESREFAKDEDFTAFLEEVKSDADDYKQEAANIGLSKLGRPGAGNPRNNSHFLGEPQGMSDEELDELAKMF